MQISARADYALRTVMILAAEARTATAEGRPVRPLPAEVIALRADLPARFLETVITKLRQVGIIHSQRGSGGGCTLGRDAGSISLYDVLFAVDGPVVTVRGLDPDELDYTDHAAGLAVALQTLKRSIISELAATTIESLIVPRNDPK